MFAGYLSICFDLFPAPSHEKLFGGNPPRGFRGNLQKKKSDLRNPSTCVYAYANVYFKTLLRPGSAFEPGYLRVSPVLRLHLYAFQLYSAR